MDIIKVSVVLPCYNVEKYIRRGLDAILAQSLQEWEAILVDDGATDSTGSICDEYAKRDKRFRVMHQENGGVSRARNAGMADAQGELLYFMDPDDWIEPNCFKRCYEIYLQYDSDMVQFEKYWVFGNSKNPGNGMPFGVWSHERIIKEYTAPMIGLGQEALNLWYKKRNSIWSYKKNLGIWCFMFRRSFIVENNILFQPDLRMFEDVIFAVESTIFANKLVSLPDVLYNYNVRDTGTVISRTKDSQKIFDDKYNLLASRARLRCLVKEYDLHDYYLGSQVLSVLQLAIALSVSLKYYEKYTKYVLNPYVQESIKKIKINFTPLKFSIPVMILKLRFHLLLYMACWIMNKLGVAKRITM